MNRRFIEPKLADGICAVLAEISHKIQIHKRDQLAESDGKSTKANLLGRAFFWFHQIIRLCSWAYLACLCLLTLGFHLVGQNNITTAALMYLPPWLWILPTVLLLPLTLLFDWKSFLALGLTSLVYGMFHMGYQPTMISHVSNADMLPNSIRVLTWNRGQSRGVSLQPLKNELKPDFILLQDAGRRFESYRNNPEYAEFKDVVSSNEFTLLSRWPVKNSESLAFSAPSASGISHPAAARFEVSADSGPIVIYSIHLHTPRGALESYKHGSFIYGLIGVPGTPWGEKRKIYQSFWDLQMRVAKEIATRIERESVPVIVAGDFNTPAFGPIYGCFGELLLDAHKEAGKGFGYSFPGNSKSVFTLRRPWLRLDQIFVSSKWEVLNSATVEANAQHLPVFADIRLR